MTDKRSLEIVVSDNIVFYEDEPRSENYFIKDTNTIIELDTTNLEPIDLRKLADHIEARRAGEDVERVYIKHMDELSEGPTESFIALTKLGKQ